jgi:hypothetical protein
MSTLSRCSTSRASRQPILTVISPWHGPLANRPPVDAGELHPPPLATERARRIRRDRGVRDADWCGSASKSCRERSRRPWYRRTSRRATDFGVSGGDAGAADAVVAEAVRAEALPGACDGVAHDRHALGSAFVPTLGTDTTHKIGAPPWDGTLSVVGRTPAIEVHAGRLPAALGRRRGDRPATHGRPLAALPPRPCPAIAWRSDDAWPTPTPDRGTHDRPGRRACG